MPLDGVLRERLKSGPMSVADYMAHVVGHPRYGYYHRAETIGRGGDFITAPEISQIFGELIGLWLAHLWMLYGQPPDIHLVELGPGRGSLLTDALRACEKVAKPFLAAARLHAVETSPSLRKAQRRAWTDRDVTWHDDLSTLPAGPLFLIANEFFDALPIQQFIRTEQGWAERQIGFAEAASEQLSFVKSEARCEVSAFASKLVAAPLGSIFELGRAGQALAAEICRRIARDKGAALIIDYGYCGPALGDTMQAVKRHRFHPVLADPGEADLTAHVDFAALANAAAAAGAKPHGPVSQGAFLQRIGFVERSQKLVEAANAQQAEDLRQSTHRLLDQGQMGEIFKVLAITDHTISIAPGFVA